MILLKSLLWFKQGISSLPPQSQKVFLMSRIEGKKYVQIAEELMLSQKTIETHLSKALKIRRKILKNELTAQ
jgi:RNA polymerase sigma factor (sigma-70 family)